MYNGKLEKPSYPKSRESPKKNPDTPPKQAVKAERETWGDTEKIHSPEFERLRTIAATIQVETGITFEKETLFLVDENAKQTRTFNQDRRLGENRVGLQLTAEASDDEITHELAHELIKHKISGIHDPAVRESLTEGLCDLIAYSVSKNNISFRQMLEKHEQTIHTELPNKMKEDFLEKRHLGNLYEDGTCHMVGRFFINEIITANPDLSCRLLIEKLTTHFPTREQLINPESYDLTGIRQIETKSVEPTQTYFREAPKRII